MLQKKNINIRYCKKYKSEKSKKCGTKEKI
jgi:hypothetical protein